MQVTMRGAAVVLTAVMGLAGCTSGGEPTADNAAEGAAEETTGGAEDSDATGADDATGAEDTPTEELAANDEQEPAQDAGSGTATVQVDGETFTFRVIQCLRDVPSPMGGTVAFQLDGVPTDTAPELVEPLLGPIDPDANFAERLEPVLEGGPILSVSRVADGGDVIAVSTALDSAYVTTADVTSVDARFLDISDAASGATVQGSAEATTPQGANAQMSVDAVCP